jgi:hypothetical protein
MPQLYDLKDLLEKTGLPERTARYYLAKVLDAPGGTPGRKAWYTQETLDQLLLTKDVLMREYDPGRGEVKPSLREFKNWLHDLSAKDIHEMVESPFRIKPKVLTTPSDGVPKRIQQSPMEPLSVQDEYHQVTEWTTCRFGNDLQIRTRKGLTPGQQRQIELAGQLLLTLLEGGAEIPPPFPKGD